MGNSVNVFYLDNDPKVCSTYHNDKHCVKMILEYAQLMSTAHRVLDGNDANDLVYKATHKNHPSTIWARTNGSNYEWLYELFVDLSNEYTYRYGRVHMTDEKLRELLNEIPRNMELGTWRQPPQAMPDDVKTESSLEAYHKYYAVYKKDFAVWTDRPVPEFMSELQYA